MPWWAGGRHNPKLNSEPALTPAYLPLQHISDIAPTSPAEFIYYCVDEDEDELVSGPTLPG